MTKQPIVPTSQDRAESEEHAKRFKKKIADLEGLLSAERSKPISEQNKRQIDGWEREIAGLKNHLKHP